MTFLQMNNVFRCLMIGLLFLAGSGPSFSAKRVTLGKHYYNEMSPQRLLKLANNMLKNNQHSEADKLLGLLSKNPSARIRLEVAKIRARRRDSLRDTKRARLLFREILSGRSASRDKAAFELARMYRTDPSLDRQHVVLKMYKLAAQLGNEKAHAEIANVYLNGIGVKVNIAEAYHHYQKAALKQSAAPIIAFARYLKRNPGINKSNIKPKQIVDRFYSKLLSEATGGYPAAAKELARLHLEGDMKPQSVKKARRWLRQAVIGGDVGALRDLALMELSISGDQKNVARSIEMLRNAAAAGNSAAKATLAKLEDRLSLSKLNSSKLKTGGIKN